MKNWRNSMDNALALYYLRKIKYIKDTNDSLYIPVVMTHADIGTSNKKDKLCNEFIMLYELLHNSGVLPDMKKYEEFLRHKHNKIAEMNSKIGMQRIFMDSNPYGLDFFEPYIARYERFVKDEQEKRQKEKEGKNSIGRDGD